MKPHHRARAISRKSLLLFLAQLPAITSSAFIDPGSVDYGYWKANVSVRTNSLEARVCIVSAEYWAYPGLINQWSTIHSSWLGTIGSLAPASYDDLSFGANDIDGEEEQSLIMWQTVTLNGVGYDIEGEAMVAMKCGEPPQRLCTGSVLVDATLRVPGGPAAGHIPTKVYSIGFSQETTPVQST
ncbi:hypothetical protein NPX13_g7852 [Xylaria arbuscula]|uniref:Uncharacterized protein n=1 Tax=Xylaria arbuscula TaxID=114810 RepID=A0A9W8TJ48_9PEZI|nr:hypothetical protein NPX13_g7852 [Xylaria arbuscula]